MKAKSDNDIENIEIKEELEKTKKKDKKLKKKNKSDSSDSKKQKKEEKKLKKEEKKEKKNNKKKKKRKKRLNKLNIVLILFFMLFVSVAVITVLYGVGVFKIKLKDPGPNYYTLSEKVEIGDYVNYDAGNWHEDKDVPNMNVPFTFGGYKIDGSRNDSTSCNYNEIDNSGWRVFNVNEDTVTLIHAGISMCYYHSYGSSTNDTSISILNNLSDNKFDYFLDGKYGESTRILSKEDIDKFVAGDSSYMRIRNDLINVGIPYWLATKNGTHYMWYVTEGGTVAVDHVGNYGVRVLVTLKENVKTTGPDKDGIWVLADEIKKDE